MFTIIICIDTHNLSRKGQKMRGSKKQRGDNSWHISVYLGKDPKTNRSIYHRETVHGGPKAADDRIAELITQRNSDEYIKPTKTILGEFADQWLESVKTRVTEGTYDDYKSIVENHLKKESLSKLQLTKIETEHIERYKIRKLNTSRLDGRPGKISPKTVKNHLIVIRAIFSYAVKLKKIKYNVAADVEFPIIPKYKAKTFTESQAAKFLEVARKDRFYLLFILTIYFGKRQGEIRGLRMEDIDLESLTASIRQTIRKSGSKAIYKDPKTNESIKVLELEKWMIPLFENRFEEIKAEKLSFGSGYEDHDLLFCSLNGRPVDLKVLDRHFKKIIKDAELPVIRFHDLRHTCATILLKRGVNLKLTQERLAHSDIRTTGNTYSHVTPTMQRTVNKEMDKALKIKALTS